MTREIVSTFIHQRWTLEQICISCKESQKLHITITRRRSGISQSFIKSMISEISLSFLNHYLGSFAAYDSGLSHQSDIEFTIIACLQRKSGPFQVLHVFPAEKQLQQRTAWTHTCIDAMQMRIHSLAHSSHLGAQNQIWTLQRCGGSFQDRQQQPLTQGSSSSCRSSRSRTSLVTGPMTSSLQSQILQQQP